MIDFTGVGAITIPEGSVKKITRGTEVLWEKPSDGTIAVYQATMPVTLFGSVVFFNNTIVFTRPANIGEKYIIYINNDSGHTGTATLAGNYLEIMTDDGVVDLLGNTANDVTSFNGRLSGAYSGNVTIEIRYVPE